VRCGGNWKRDYGDSYTGTQGETPDTAKEPSTDYRASSRPYLAELRTDLDDFSTDESRALMACGYQMASKAFARDLAHLKLDDLPVTSSWTFDALRAEITSTASSTPMRARLLDALRNGSQSKI